MVAKIMAPSICIASLTWLGDTCGVMYVVILLEVAPLTRSKARQTRGKTPASGASEWLLLA